MSMVDALLIFSSCCLLQIEPIMTVGATQNILPAKRIMLLGTIFALVQAGITVVGVLGAHYINVLIVTTASEALVPYLTFALLITLAAYMIYKAFHFGDFTEALVAYMTGGGIARLALRWCPPILLTGVVLGLSEVSPEKWSSLNEKNSGSKSPNLLRGWQKRLVSGMLVRCADGSNCSHFSTD